VPPSPRRSSARLHHHQDDDQSDQDTGHRAEDAPATPEVLEFRRRRAARLVGGDLAGQGRRVGAQRDDGQQDIEDDGACHPEIGELPRTGEHQEDADHGEADVRRIGHAVVHELDPTQRPARVLRFTGGTEQPDAVAHVEANGDDGEEDVQHLEPGIEVHELGSVAEGDRADGTTRVHSG